MAYYQNGFCPQCRGELRSPKRYIIKAQVPNNDAERALRPVMVHPKVSGGARSHWGGQLVAMIFSFLETMRLQGKNAVEELFNLLAGERSPPQADFVLSI